MTTGLVAAGAAAVAYGLASVLQAVGVRGGALRRWWASRWYLAGLALDGAAWLVSLIAVRTLPLFVVQSVLAASLAVTAVGARLWLGATLRRRQVVAIAAVLAALVVLAAAGGTQSARPAPPWFTVATWVVTIVLVLATWALSRRRSSAALAVLAGLGFSMAATAARAAHGGGASALAHDPVVWAVPVAGAVGATAYAQALERGAVSAATALLWVVETVVPTVVGVTVLGDRVRPGLAAPALVAIVVAVAACVVLARGVPSGDPERRRRRPPQGSR